MQVKNPPLYYLSGPLFCFFKHLTCYGVDFPKYLQTNEFSEEMRIENKEVSFCGPKLLLATLKFGMSLSLRDRLSRTQRIVTSS